MKLIYLYWNKLPVLIEVKGDDFVFINKDELLQEWRYESALTQKILDQLTDESLDQLVIEGHNSLGWLGWHLAGAVYYFSSVAGLSIESPGVYDVVPSTAKEISSAYQKVSDEFISAVHSNWQDADLHQVIEFFGQNMPVQKLIRTMISHQIHHRGQMTVLMRQAGLRVPGLYGPSKEEMEEQKATK